MFPSGLWVLDRGHRANFSVPYNNNNNNKNNNDDDKHYYYYYYY